MLKGKEDSMILIDFEHHYYLPEFFDLIRDREGVPSYDSQTGYIKYVDTDYGSIAVPVPDPILDLGEGRLQRMDAAGIDVAVLSSCSGPELLKGREAVEFARLCNDRVFETMQKYPGRFLGTATLPVDDPDAACEELRRCVRELGFIGWHTHSNYGESWLDEPKYFKILQTAAEEGVYVYVHPFNPSDRRLVMNGKILNGACLGYTVDTMNTVLSLILNGTFDRLPDLRVLVGHLGESLPFLLWRIESKLWLPFYDDERKFSHHLSHYFKNNIYLTTSGNLQKSAFALTKEVIGIDNLLVGYDYPFENSAETYAFLEDLLLSREEREKLYYKNAERLLGKRILPYSYRQLKEETAS